MEKRQPAPRKGCRALILSPTRELATQIADSFKAYGRWSGLSVAVIFGGVSHRPQREALHRGIDILVAAPGRLIDHLMAGDADLSATEIFVLDEADQMLDLGFIKPIRSIVAKLPKQRQNLFFSATMPTDIGALAGELLKDPARVAVTPVARTADRVSPARDPSRGGREAHRPHRNPARQGCRARHRLHPHQARADKVAEHLSDAGIGAAAIHGNKSQGQREKALGAFRSGQLRILVATDIAARGIDVPGVSHVVNFELPEVPEAYVHRIAARRAAGRMERRLRFARPMSAACSRISRN